MPRERGMTDSQYAQQQQIDSRRGQADGQCLGCGAFRLDGEPPERHLNWCRHARRER
jgi:hypothetical protein